VFGRVRCDSARAAAAVVLATLTTCSSGGAYTRDDVQRIVLVAADAPQGTEYVADLSGPQALQEFARDPDELALLREEGFEIGHLSLFVPTGYAAPEPSKEPLEADAVLVQGIAGLFEDADGAESALRRFVADVRERQLREVRDLDASGLGDQGFALAGMSPDGSDVTLFAWRDDNLVLAVSGSGAIPEADVRRLAELVEGRARGA
jgi:hypothetical protein